MYVSSVPKERHLIRVFFFSLRLKTLISLSFQLAFILSSQQQNLDLGAINNRLKQQCLGDPKNHINDSSKFISELIFANFIDSFTKTRRTTFFNVKEQSPAHVLLPLLLFTCFPALTAGFMISRAYRGYTFPAFVTGNT